MKTLPLKEIRLLLPAYVVALVLAIVPVGLLYCFPNTSPIALAFYPFCLGCALLAVSAFGREFGLHTFALILAQPLARPRLWWTKVAVLALAMTTLLAVWWFTCFTFAHPGTWSMQPLTLSMGLAVAVVTFAGGLWTTLLLRQVTAAFWFTLLIPLAIVGIIEAAGGSEECIYVALGLYSAAGFAGAWRYFARTQEVGWTGGVINLPPWDASAAQSNARAPGWFGALVRKELRLLQVPLLGMGALFVIHLAAQAVLKFGQNALGPALRVVLEVFGGVWLFVPLLAGCASVGEERELGVMEGLQCLPVSRRVQFVLKLSLVLLVAGLLSALLLWTAEGIGRANLGLSTALGMFKVAFDLPTLLRLCSWGLALALISFYASTLARSNVQALGAALATALLVWGFLVFTANPTNARLWQGPLAFLISCPVLVGTFVWLAYHNFSCGAEREHFWRRNLLVIAVALLFITGSSAILYNRVWELLERLEPAHGPVRLAGPRQAVLSTYYGERLTALLPDGRLWVEHISYAPDQASFAPGEPAGVQLGQGWMGFHGEPVVAGSNWVHVAAATPDEAIAIRADGTLWIVGWPRVRPAALPGEPASDAVQFGTDTNWQEVVQSPWVLLLKSDGTLWRWNLSANAASAKNRGGRALGFPEPYRLGMESDWTRLRSAGNHVYAWKRGGAAWVLHPAIDKTRAARELQLEPDLAIERLPDLDNFKCQSVVSFWPVDATLREDHTLWAWRLALPPGQYNGFSFQASFRVGKDADWAAVASDSTSLWALKTDGSLWRWGRWDWSYGKEISPLTRAPHQVSTHHDWLGICGSTAAGYLSLAADGSLWYWRDRDAYYGWSIDHVFSASRRPVRIENILGEL